MTWRMTRVLWGPGSGATCRRMDAGFVGGVVPARC
ncbi:uncharacterized protein G2W53_002514 [Senna tora]|uniref:Uncharacterized protein n=1 Tax=Senna tora TaxID=362788 RepID=A0A835CKE7_9FABA|nr:uncharacterized protein G2W53_002514 [Senna tora]